MNKNCDAIRQQLPAYTDKALPDSEAAAVKAHLETCKRCRTFAALFTPGQTAEERMALALQHFHQVRHKQAVAIRILTAILAVILIAAAYGGVMWSLRAGGIQKLDFISANDYWGGAKLRLPYQAKGTMGGATTDFFSEDSPEQMAKKFEALGSKGAPCTAKVFAGGNVLIHQTAEGGREAWYALLAKTPDRPVTHYHLCGMEAIMPPPERKDPQTGEGTAATFLCPYHLIQDERIEDSYVRFENGLLYGTAYPKQEFLDFYRAVSQYEVTETERGFQIEEKKEGADRINYAFYEINGRRYFSMTAL